MKYSAQSKEAAIAGPVALRDPLSTLAKKVATSPGDICRSTNPCLGHAIDWNSAIPTNIHLIATDRLRAVAPENCSSCRCQISMRASRPFLKDDRRSRFTE